ncbi:MAG: hypothetical protein AAF531_00060 [Actinomycetota bacterium]
MVLSCLLLVTACSDSDDEGDAVGKASEEVADGDGVVAESLNETTAVPRPEQSVPDLAGRTEENITIGGWVFESNGTFLLCEAAGEGDPPTCEGETMEISNGEVIDETIFLGEAGSRYSDAQVVVTGDVVDGVLTIG